MTPEIPVPARSGPKPLFGPDAVEIKTTLPAFMGNKVMDIAKESGESTKSVIRTVLAQGMYDAGLITAEQLALVTETMRTARITHHN